MKNRIIEKCKEQHLTTKRVAEILGVTIRTVYSWCENTRFPSGDNLLELCRVLDCDLKELFYE